jgi:Protein of unknown function (DUF4235)
MAKHEDTAEPSAASVGSHASATLVRVFGGLAAAMLARKIVNLIWVAAAGHKPPAEPESPDVGAREAITFAVATGVIAGVLQMLVHRKANAISSGRDAARARRAEKRGGSQPASTG